MTGRNAFLFAAALTAATVDLVLWRAFKDATETAQRLATERADHRCPLPGFPSAMLESKPPVFPVLVEPAPAVDPAIARNAYSLGGRSDVAPH